MLPSAHICWASLCGQSPGAGVTLHKDSGARTGQGPADTEGCPSSAPSSGRSSGRNSGELGTSPGRGMEQHRWKCPAQRALQLLSLDTVPGAPGSSSREHTCLREK